MLKLGSTQGRWTLIVTVLGSSMAFLDGTIVNVALHTIKVDLNTGISGIQWIVDAYLLTLGALIVLGGSLGDMYGLRRLFVFGVVGFSAASLLCGLAPNALVLILARAVQGIAGALLVPASLAIISANFEPADRGKAIGIWSGATSGFIAVGPLVGGWLVGYSWRLAFLINLPIAAVTVAFALAHVPERASTTKARPDFIGALVVSVGLAGAVYSLIEGPAHGFTTTNIAIGIVGALALIAFPFVESRVKEPMIPLSIFSSKQFSGANLVTASVYACLGVAAFLVILFLQDERGYSPVESAVSFLPISLMLITLSPQMGGLTTRYGPRVPMTVGPFLLGLGLLMMSGFGDSGSYLTTIFPYVLIFGLGLAITVAPLTTAVMTSIPSQHSGIGSAINNAVARIGNLLAVAAVPAVTGFAAASGPHTRAYLNGFHNVMLVCAALAAVGALTAWITIRNPAVPQPVAATE